MHGRPHPEWFTFTAGSLLVLAGLRDLVAPGFLNISHSAPTVLDGLCALGAGVVLVWCSLKRTRAAGSAMKQG